MERGQKAALYAFCVGMSALGVLGAVVPGLAWMLSKIAGHAY